MRRITAALALFAVVAASAREAGGQVFIAAPPTAGPPGTNPLTAPLDGPKPEFEVASVRPDNGPSDRLSLTSPPGRFIVSGLPLQLVLSLAFRPQNNQTDGIPAWVANERFDINAKMPDGAPQEQLPLMLQSLLEDRFKLRWHTETREMDVYELVVAREDGRLGPKLAPSAGDVDCKPILEARQKAAEARLKAIEDARAKGASTEALLELVRPSPGETLRCGTSVQPPPPGNAVPAMLTLTARDTELTNLLSTLTSLSGRPVVDRTGLTGLFDFEFTIAPTMLRTLTASAPGAPTLAAPTAGAAPTGPGALPGFGAPVPRITDDGPTIFQAVEEQLGLKLQSARGSGEFFVVDSIERPDPD